MKFVQEFDVDQSVTQLWALFEQPEIVAECMPGMEEIQTIDQDNFTVRVKQSVGPISATFESRVHVIERVKERRVAFSATGKAVRGAVGNFRAQSVVHLESRGDAAHVRVESEAALAGVLGSVGQKVIARQAEKITEAFATNLQTRLSGGSPSAESTTPTGKVPVNSERVPVRSDAGSKQVAAAGGAPIVGAPEPWAKIAAVLALVNVMIGLAILVSLT